MLAWPSPRRGAWLSRAAFPPAGFWPLAAAGPALLVVALWQRSLAGRLAAGLVFGLAFFVPLLSWLINLAWYAWIALALAEALIFAVLAVGQRLLLRLRVWPLAVAAGGSRAEALRDRWPSTASRGRLAMSQAARPRPGWSAIGGRAAADASCWRWPAPRWPGCAAPAARGGPGRASRRAARGCRGGAPSCPSAAPAAPPTGPARAATATVAAVQGNVPHARTLILLRATTVTANHAAATDALATAGQGRPRPAPDLVIWPENSTDIDPRLSAADLRRDRGRRDAIASRSWSALCFNNPLRNAGQLWLPRRGPVEIYVKRQLVPFGEVIPLRGLIDRVTSLPDLQPRNFTPGHRGVVFRIGKIRLGDVICYEVGFDNLVRSEVRRGRQPADGADQRRRLRAERPARREPATAGDGADRRDLDRTRGRRRLHHRPQRHRRP